MVPTGAIRPAGGELRGFEPKTPPAALASGRRRNGGGVFSPFGERGDRRTSGGDRQLDASETRG